MKTISILLITTFLCLNGYCQKPFVIINATALKYDKVEVQPAASLSFGIHWQFLSLGAGAGVTKFKDGNAYVPLYGEVSGFNTAKKVSPYLSFKVGGGVYNDQIKTTSVTVTTSGGLYVSPSAGAMFQVGSKNSVIFSVSFVSSNFNIESSTTIRNSTSVTRKNTSESSVSNGFGINIGFRF